MRRQRTIDAADAHRTTAGITDMVMKVGQGVFIAVLILVILGALYGTNVVAEPWTANDPTDRVTENQTIAAGGTATVNVSAAYYYDNGSHAESVENATSGASLSEGSDYEFYTNGTLENLDTSETKFNISYSYYQKNGFETMITTFSTYGTTAFTMIGLGLIAAGGWAAMRYFGGIDGGSAR